jgi:Flp pilus assembly protein TadD
MRIIYVSALAFIVLSAGLYFAFHDLLFPIPGTPVEEIAERIGGGGFEKYAAMLRPTDAIEALDDASFILAPEEPFELADLRTDEVRMPDEVLAALKAGNRRAYPIEIASLAVATLRSRRHGSRPARVMEVTALEGLRSPDPTGRMGYYVVEVDGETLDVFGARKDARVTSGRPLEDVEAVAAAGALVAMVAISRGGDPSLALRMAQRAHQLDPKSPSIRAIEGTTFLMTGQFEEGAGELEAAVSLSPDPARKNLLGAFKLMMEDPAGGMKLVSEALAEDPELGPAYLTRASYEMARGNMVGARSSLVKAEQLDPDLPLLAVLLAQVDLSENDRASASRRMLAEVKKRPDDPQTHMAAVQIFHAVESYDAMRRSVQAVLRLTPPEIRPMIQEQIVSMFGPTALMPPLDADDDGDEDEEEPPARLELRLDPAVSPFGDEFKLKDPTLERGGKMSLELAN